MRTPRGKAGEQLVSFARHKLVLFCLKLLLFSFLKDLVFFDLHLLWGVLRHRVVPKHAGLPTH